MDKIREKPLNLDLDHLQIMNVASLIRLHNENFPSDRPVANGVFLRRKLAWQLQAESDGGLPEAAKQRALSIAREVELRIRAAWSADRRRTPASATAVSSTMIPLQDSRLPMPGSLLSKKFKGRMIIVTVLEEGFEYEARHYPSLSTIAKA